jgi:hypothetical protein
MWTALVEALRRAAAEVNCGENIPISGSAFETRGALSRFLTCAADQLARKGVAPMEDLLRIFAPTGVWDRTSNNRFLGGQIWTMLNEPARPLSPDSGVRAAIEQNLGLADPACYIEEEQREMGGESSADWAVLLAGAPMPSSTRHWMRLRVSACPEPWGTVETRSAPNWICSPPADRPLYGVVVHLAELEGAQALEFIHMLGGASEQDLTHVVEDRKMLDGYFCKLAVIRKNPWRVTNVKFTLSAVSEKMYGQPAVKVARAVLKHRARIES